MSALRTMCFDIECTSLDASYGRILCVCAKFDDEKSPRTLSAPLLKDEKALLRAFSSWWAEADIVAGWNSKLFDVAFLNARRMFHRLLPLDPSKKHIDLLFQSKKLRFRGNRLDGVSKDLRTKCKKYDVPAYRWVEAAEGQPLAQSLIIKHCQLDVLLTEEMLLRLKPLLVHITR